MTASVYDNWLQYLLYFLGQEVNTLHHDMGHQVEWHISNHPNFQTNCVVYFGSYNFYIYFELIQQYVTNLLDRGSMLPMNVVLIFISLQPSPTLLHYIDQHNISGSMKHLSLFSKILVIKVSKALHLNMSICKEYTHSQMWSLRRKNKKLTFYD